MVLELLFGGDFCAAVWWRGQEQGTKQPAAGNILFGLVAPRNPMTVVLHQVLPG